MAAKKAPSYSTRKPKTKKRKAAQELDRFVEGTAEKKPRGLVPRADGSAMRRMTVYVRPELYKAARVHVAELDKNLSEWVAGLIEHQLGG